MKNLKKLSVVIFATLLSFNFTSCLDTDVSPVVEGIYQAQAELLSAEAALAMAEATLADAEAALAMAQAMSEAVYAEANMVLQQARAEDLVIRAEAYAAYYAGLAAVQEANATKTEAETAAYIAMQEAVLAAYIADEAQALAAAISLLERQEATAALALMQAQVTYDNSLLQLARNVVYYADQNATTYTNSYKNAMDAIATLKGFRLTAVQNIAMEELFMQTASSVPAGSEMTWAVYLQNLEDKITAKLAAVAANEAYLERANAYLGDVDLMAAALLEATQAVTDTKEAIATLEKEDITLASAIATENAAFITAFETLDGQLTGLMNDKKGHEDNAARLDTIVIPMYTAAIADYEALTATLQADVDAAEARVGALKETSHASGHPDGFGLLEAKKVANDSINAKQSDYDAARTAISDTYASKDAAITLASVTLASFTDDLTDLYGSYQAAAAAWEAVQNTASDTTALAEIVEDKEEARDDYETGALADALEDYEDALAIFEADPDGTVDTDSDATNLDGSLFGDFDDSATKTYRRVATWKESTPGAYVPDTFYAAEFTEVTIASEVARLVASTETTGAVSTSSPTYTGAYDIVSTASVTLWPATATSTISLAERIAAIGLPGGTDVEADIQAAYFIDVEADDSSINNLDTVSQTIADLGEVVELPLMVQVGTSTTMEPNSPITSPTTANEIWWNLRLDVVIAEYNLANAATYYDDVVAEYEKQQALFETADELRVAYEAALTAALAAKSAAVTAWTNVDRSAVKEYEDLYAAICAELGSYDFDANFDYKTSGEWNLPLTWDIHANDLIVNAADYVAFYTVSATWDSSMATDTTDPTYGADALNAYAAEWNAKLALAIHKDMTLVEYEAALEQAETDLVSATNLIAENNILITRWTADVAALQAEYDALKATPLYAEMQVRRLEIADEIAVLNAQCDVLMAEKTALEFDIALENFAGTGDDLGLTAIGTAMTAAQGIINGAPAFIANIEAQIALGEVSVEQMENRIADWMEEIADIDAEIATQTERAAVYKALLLAVLATLG